MIYLFDCVWVLAELVERVEVILKNPNFSLIRVHLRGDKIVNSRTQSDEETTSIAQRIVKETIQWINKYD